MKGFGLACFVLAPCDEEADSNAEAFDGPTVQRPHHHPSSAMRDTDARLPPHQHQHIYPSDQPPTPQHNTGKHQSKMRPRGVKKGGDAGKLAEALKELLDVSG